jgi:periplasmic divalent cation tolerance protein
MFCVVLVTAKDEPEAKRLGEKLVSEKLAACVSVVPKVSSVYRWRGKIERAGEALILIKTSKKKLDRLIPRIEELHSYEVPEVLVLPIERGAPKYLKWLEENLR